MLQTFSNLAKLDDRTIRESERKKALSLPRINAGDLVISNDEDGEDFSDADELEEEALLHVDFASKHLSESHKEQQLLKRKASSVSIRVRLKKLLLIAHNKC